jgi:hypothetical protein
MEILCHKQLRFESHFSKEVIAASEGGQIHCSNLSCGSGFGGQVNLPYSQALTTMAVIINGAY